MLRQYLQIFNVEEYTKVKIDNFLREYIHTGDSCRSLIVIMYDVYYAITLHFALIREITYVAWAINYITCECILLKLNYVLPKS